MKWLFICVWFISTLFFCFRGKIRPTFGKTVINHSVMYGFQHPSALASCPRSITRLKKVKCIKAAILAELPNGKLNPHRDPFAGPLRYHLGLVTPNFEKCYFDADGQRY